jgi:UBP3-associated protein BRE5
MPSTEAITYSFARFYYSQLHEDPSKLYQIYSTNAKLTHSTIPSFDANELNNNVKKPIETKALSTHAEIQSFYADLNLKDSKIRISNIDSQSILNEKSILVNVLGELALTDESPVFRFTQSFILTPGSAQDTYDIANDIFSLISDDYLETAAGNEQKEEKDTTAEASETTVNAAEPVKVTEDLEKDVKEPEVKQEINKEAVKEAVKEERQKTPDANETKESKDKDHPKKSSKVAKPDSKQHIKKESKSPKQETKQKIDKTEVKAESKESEPSKEIKEEPKQEEDGSEDKENVAPVNSSIKLSWAEQIAATDKPFAVSKPKPTPKPKEASKSPQPAAPAPKASTQTATTTKPPGPKRKPDHSHPVIVSGIGELAATEIRVQLEREFGKTVKVEPKGRYALVSFETSESRQKALKKKTLSINEHVVKIEDKSDSADAKKPNQANNNNNTNNTKPYANKPNQKQSNGSINKKKPATKQNA